MHYYVNCFNNTSLPAINYLLRINFTGSLLFVVLPIEVFKHYDKLKSLIPQLRLLKSLILREFVRRKQVIKLYYFRSSPSVLFIEKGVQEIYSKFTEDHISA